MFYKENKLVSRNDIPQVVLSNLKDGIPYEYKLEPPQEVSKTCLICDAPAKLTRIVNMKVLALCHDHYYSETIGKLAQAIREKE